MRYFILIPCILVGVLGNLESAIAQDASSRGATVRQGWSGDYSVQPTSRLQSFLQAEQSEAETAEAVEGDATMMFVSLNSYRPAVSTYSPVVRRRTLPPAIREVSVPRHRSYATYRNYGASYGYPRAVASGCSYGPHYGYGYRRHPRPFVLALNIASTYVPYVGYWRALQWRY